MSPSVCSSRLRLSAGRQHTPKKNGAPPEGKRAAGSGKAAPPCRLAPSGKSEVDQKWYSAFTIGVLADAPGTCLLSLPNLLCQYW
jgi:hypothetical protein